MDNLCSADTGVLCLVFLARYHGLAADPAQLKHQFTDSATCLDDNGLLRAARFLKLRARKVKARPAQLQNLPLPAIVQHTDGHYFILAKIHEDQALIQDPRQAAPESVSLKALGSHDGAACVPADPALSAARW